MCPRSKYSASSGGGDYDCGASEFLETRREQSGRKATFVLMCDDAVEILGEAGEAVTLDRSATDEEQGNAALREHYERRFHPGLVTAREPQKKIGMIRIATMFTTLIIGLIAGPLVSL